ncbi:hypothetical protein [Prosthecobacter sp.]|uniref:hypothetical protein n=1 Tax=Prosthecobacter sp. TaxID=1965333 RepID=UPI002ABA438A|nr:hypothetical protein [Prosthecobacter sp.]MDZ4401608.1 hypothetical protein [Prosthecobacter sp.]
MGGELKLGNEEAMLRGGGGATGLDTGTAGDLLFSATGAVSRLLSAATAPVAETDDAPWLNADAAVTRDAATIIELIERWTGIGGGPNWRKCSRFTW